MNNVAEAVKAEIFIVPNAPMIFRDGEGQYSWSENIKKKMAHFGIVPKDGDIFIQVWTVSPDRLECKPETWSENWADHGLPEILDDKFMWPSYFPLSILPKKEGEVMILNTENHKYELKANQVQYRYRRFGNFEQVLSTLVEGM